MKYKIFDHTWHVPHQYDMMYALRHDCDFYYCLNTKKQWDISQRPIPPNLKFVTSYEPGYYDIAILHIDQQTMVPDHQKRMIYQEFDQLITDIPKIVLNHGTPVFPERFYELQLQHLSYAEMQDRCIASIRSIVGSNQMVVNSHTSASNSEWGFGHAIVHGMNPEDWWDLPKEPRVFTALAPYGFDFYYNRECMFDVSDLLFNDHGYTLAYAKLNINTSSSPEDYKNYLGRSLIYLDTSIRTPMNRARTEAFLSGCCVIQVEGAHDLDRWAKNGENMIILPNDPKIIADEIADILENRYQEALEIGKRGKLMAQKMFSPERYRSDWVNLISKTINNKIHE